MNKICPLCNGLFDYQVNCPRCDESLEDLGQVENTYEPYSPYEDDLLMEAPKSLLKPKYWCQHIFSCPKCGFKSKRFMEQIEVNQSFW